MRARDLRSAALISSLSVLNIAFGFLFQALLANRLGTSSAADVFAAGASVPTVIATAALGAGPIVLIPAFSHQLADGQGGLTRRAIAHITLLGLLTSLVLLPLAGVVARGVAPGFDDAERQLLVTFLRIVSVVPLLAVLAAVGQAFAFGSRRFGIAGASAAVNGLCLLGCAALLLPGGLTSTELAWAVVAGYAGQVLWVTPTARRALRALPADGQATAVRAPALVNVFVFMAATSVLYKSQPVIERLVGSTVSDGLPATLAYAGRFSQGLTMLASFGVSLVAMPQLADALARKEGPLARRIVSVSLAVTLAFTLGVLAFSLAAYEVMPRLVLARGAFTDADARLTAQLLLASLPGILFGTLAGPLVNVFYAIRRQRFVAVAATTATVVGGVASLLLAQPWHGPGITLGTSIGYGVSLGLFAGLLPRAVPGWSWRRFGRDVAPLLLAGAVAMALGVLAARVVGVPDGAVTQLLVLIVEAVLSAAVVVVVAVACGWQLGRRWLRRRLATR